MQSMTIFNSQNSKTGFIVEKTKTHIKRGNIRKQMFYFQFNLNKFVCNLRPSGKSESSTPCAAS